MAKEYYLSLDGKRIDLTEDQLKKLGINLEDKSSSFDRVIDDKYANQYYYISNFGEIMKTQDTGADVDDRNYCIANYCTGEDLLKKRLYRDILNRLLWRFSMRNEGDKINYLDNSIKYYIYYHNEYKKRSYRVNCNMNHLIQGVVYFYTEEIANRAINEIVISFYEAYPDAEVYL